MDFIKPARETCTFDGHTNVCPMILTRMDKVVAEDCTDCSCYVPKSKEPPPSPKLTCPTCIAEAHRKPIPIEPITPIMEVLNG